MTVAENEAWLHELFRSLNSRLTKKRVKHTVWEAAAAAAAAKSKYQRNDEEMNTSTFNYLISFSSVF